MKFNKNALIIFLFASCFLVGCNSPNHPTSFVSPVNPYDYGLLNTEQTNLNIIIPKLEEQYYTNDISTTEGENNRRRIREEITYRLLCLADEYYRKWISVFYGRGEGFKTIADTTAPTLSAVSAATTGGASTALALASSGIGALNVSVSKNYLQDTAITLLIARSDALRDSIRVRINSNMTNSTALYPLGSALMDFQDYARAGSLPAAAQAIQGDTASAKNAADTNLTVNAQAAGGTPAGGKPAGGTPAGGTPAGGTPAGGKPAGG
jgi:hypothetical protein